MKRPDLLLTHGYCLDEDPVERQVMMPYPPLGLLYLSSHLKRQGHDVDVVDTTFESLSTVRARIEESKPRVVGIYGNLLTRATVLKLVTWSRAAGAFVVLGGPEPAGHCEEYLARGTDVVVIGEGEQTLGALLRSTENGRPTDEVLATIDGIAYLDTSGDLRRTSPRQQLDDLDSQPWPDRQAIDMQRYLDVWRTHHDVSSVSLITARGCPFTCTWCSHSVFGRTHRRRSVEDVANEVEWIKETYGPDRLWYADDVFTIHRRWTLEYAAELSRRNLRVPFECISRADCLSDEVVDALAEMGCHRLWIGAESGSQKILDAMKRKTRRADVQDRTRALQAKGIEVGMFIMLGYEGETEADLEETVEHLKRSAPDTFLTTVSYPIKGTDYYDLVAERVGSEHAWEKRTDRDLRIAGRQSDHYYRAATRWLVNDVRFELSRRRRRGSSMGSPLERLREARYWLAARAGRWGMSRHRSDELGASGRLWAEGEAQERRSLETRGTLRD